MVRKSLKRTRLWDKIKEELSTGWLEVPLRQPREGVGMRRWRLGLLNVSSKRNAQSRV